MSPMLKVFDKFSFYTGKGFRKVDPDKWEFAHEGFLRGKRHLLKNIRRKKGHYPSSQTTNQSQGTSLGVKSVDFDAEIDRLCFDKQVLATELAKHRQQQQSTLSWLRTMEHRLQGAEMKQRQTVSLLAKAIQNPNLLPQEEEKNEPKELVSSKRRRTPDHVSENVGVQELVFQVGDNSNFSTIGFQEIGQGSMGNAYKDDVGIGQFADGNFYVKPEPQEYGDFRIFDDSEVENLAFGMQETQPTLEGKSMENGEYKPIDEGFWEELINDGIEEIGTLGIEQGGDQRLGFLGSIQKW